MSESKCEQACASHTCDESPAGTLVGIEDYEKELGRAQQHAADLKEIIKELQSKVKLSGLADYVSEEAAIPRLVQQCPATLLNG